VEDAALKLSAQLFFYKIASMVGPSRAAGYGADSAYGGGRCGRAVCRGGGGGGVGPVAAWGTDRLAQHPMPRTPEGVARVLGYCAGVVGAGPPLTRTALRGCHDAPLHLVLAHASRWSTW
jgi:hypothetical protein